MRSKLGTCSWKQCREIVEEKIGIIRANGSEAIPLVAGFNWVYDLNGTIRQPGKAGILKALQKHKVKINFSYRIGQKAGILLHL